jgi:ADP-heptose:LPS heptosyltransferase
VIIIHPFSKALPSGKVNPKNFPYWQTLIAMIDEPIVQIGVTGERQLVDDFRCDLPIAELRSLIKKCRTWVGVDSFFQHLCWTENKPGVVLWSVSDPLIFGHPENTNLLKDRRFLTPNQFLWWDATEFNIDSFLLPVEIIPHIQAKNI